MLFSQRVTLEMFVVIGLKREHDNEIAAASARAQNLTKILEGFTRQCARRVEYDLSQAAEQVNVANVSGALAQASQRQRLIALLPIDGLNRAFVGIVTKGAIIVSTAAETSHAGISGAFNARWRYTTGGTVPHVQAFGQHTQTSRNTGQGEQIIGLRANAKEFEKTTETDALLEVVRELAALEPFFRSNHDALNA